MDVGGLRVDMSSANSANVALLQKSFGIQESLSNELIQGGIEATNEMRSQAMHSQGKGTIVNTVA